MIRTVVVYESMYGNTEAVARAIAEGLAAHLPVETVEVSKAPHALTEDDVVVVGGPTHAFGMSRAQTRRDAATQAATPVVSQAQGVREWLEQLTVITGHPSVAAFDTKVIRPRLPGSAGHAIERALQEKGCRILRPAQTFLVHGRTGPLADGEVQRARALGEELGALVTSGAHGAASGAATHDQSLAAGAGAARLTTRHILLAVLAGLTAIGAVGGGIGLINGADDFFGEQTATIYGRLPFDSPQFAGVALLLTVALPMAVTALLAWRGSRHAAALGAAAGTVLVGWIIVQLAITGTFFWLQPVCIAVGLAITTLAITLHQREPAGTRHTPSEHSHPRT